ncbi:MAG: proline--tRNA ligase [archaeon]
MTKGITVSRDDDMAEWYGQVVTKSELADYSAVKGCMIIRPRGYAIWQTIQDYFNVRLKKLGVMNAYFPLLIPESFFKKEAEHAEGFAPELAWITRKDDESSERLALRPTSETIMYDSYSRWIRSWRDLPLLINQWCNVFRWEVSDVKLFLRSREFLWQEGHCVFETKEECDTHTLNILDEYARLAEELLAIPVIKGRKTEKERFAGALYTTTIESFMPDGKALQLGTSHNLGQSFAEAFGISYVGKDEKKHTPWQNSWGFSTRLIGAIIMLHSDDQGLVLPPRIAPMKGVIVPIYKSSNRDEIFKEVEKIADRLRPYDLHIDDREEYSPGWKYNEWELKGVPIRIEFGPKDLEKGHCVFVARDTKEKKFVKLTEIESAFPVMLHDIQQRLFAKAKTHLEESIVEVDNWDDFVKYAKGGKMVFAPFDGTVETEEQIKTLTGGVTSRCVPIDQESVEGLTCVKSGKAATCKAYFSRNY